MANIYNIADFKDLDKSVGPARITGSFSSSSIFLFVSFLFFDFLNERDLATSDKLPL